MLKTSKNKTLLRNVGVVLVSCSVVLFWIFGWFNIVFYVLGLYGAIYIISYLFKTTVIINFLFGAGVFILQAASAVAGLFLLYSVLHIMFTGSFFTGLLLVILLGIFYSFLYLIPMGIGFVLGYPLIFMSKDIEKRFNIENRDSKYLE